ncbi:MULTISPECIES: hypothetical protein [Halobacillus]|nr:MULTISPECIES: hypothetical protein [Halobacillus]
MKRLFMLTAFLFLAACSSQNLSYEDLKAAYPDTFAEPVQELSEEQLGNLGLPSDMPFEVTQVSSSTGESEAEVTYTSDSGHKAIVTTLYSPGNILQDSELQVPLDSGALAGVQEKDTHVFVEWYEGEEDIIYQVEYYGPDEERAEKAVEIANQL